MLQFFYSKNLEETENLMKENLDKELGNLLESKFISPTRFSVEIEKIVKDQKTNYIEAIIIYCELSNIDVESVPKLISKPLKEKLKCEAMQLNFLKKTSRAKLLFE